MGKSDGDSIEIPDPPTLPGDVDLNDPVPLLDLSPLNLAEINAECQIKPGQALIDRLDIVRYSASRVFSLGLRMFQMLDHMVCGEDRHQLLNMLCKVCSRQRMIPKSMYTVERLNGELVEEYDGGHAIISRAEHNGRRVAVKTVRIYLTSDFGKCFSVSKTLAPARSTEVPNDHSACRNSVEKLLRGGISDTRTSFRCSVWIWNITGFRCYPSGWTKVTSTSL